LESAFKKAWRAFAPSSMHSIWVVIITLLFT